MHIHSGTPNHDLAAERGCFDLHMTLMWRLADTGCGLDPTYRLWSGIPWKG